MAREVALIITYDSVAMEYLVLFNRIYGWINSDALVLV
jgi:hypothetical protein